MDKEYLKVLGEEGALEVLLIEGERKEVNLGTIVDTKANNN